MRIVVIGANSYIARNMVYMIQHYHNKDELKLYDYHEKQTYGFGAYTQINILDKDSVKQIDMNCDIIFMFVGKTGSANGFDEYDTFIDINERSLLNVLNEYRRQQSKARIIFPSTRLVYSGLKGPQKEDAPKEAKTIYAINKIACEKYLEMYHRVYDVQYSICRICIPYGTLIPGASSYGTAEFFLGKAKKGEAITLYGDGTQRRTLTYMGDLCKNLYEVAISPDCKNDIYNIGGEDYSLLEMAKLIGQAYSVEICFIPWPEVALKIESGDTVFDSTKLESKITYRNQMTFAEWCKEQ